MMTRAPLLRLLCLAFLVTTGATLARTAGADSLAQWEREFPKADFSRTLIDLSEIIHGGPPRDGIPAIDAPSFGPAATADLDPRSPVIALAIEGQARAYPLAILMWHEIVNDEFMGIPLAVTYCPLCNAAMVFDRRHEGQVLSFGTTGRLRNSDLVMYDRETESWWQQFEGRAIVGQLAGARLTRVPVRIEGFASFLQRYPDGEVLLEPAGSYRSYGLNPYLRYDSDGPYRHFFEPSGLPDGLPAMAYVVAVGDEAWTLSLLRSRGPLQAGDLILSWSAGSASALDGETIAEGREIGNVVVQRRQADGSLRDEVYDLTFAFVFKAFFPGGTIHMN
jgi:hypothetical protein